MTPGTFYGGECWAGKKKKKKEPRKKRFGRCDGGKGGKEITLVQIPARRRAVHGHKQPWNGPALRSLEAASTKRFTKGVAQTRRYMAVGVRRKMVYRGTVDDGVKRLG